MKYVLNTLIKNKPKDNTTTLIGGEFNEDLTTNTHEDSDAPTKMSWLNMLNKHMRLLNEGTEYTFLPRKCDHSPSKIDG
eukprot:1912119-Pyramimonas_sp.AAC.1